jgi:hypothetical protein
MYQMSYITVNECVQVFGLNYRLTHYAASVIPEPFIKINEKFE